MRKIELETEDIIGIILAIVVAGFLIFALIDKKGSEMQKSEIQCTVNKLYTEQPFRNLLNPRVQDMCWKIILRNMNKSYTEDI